MESKSSSFGRVLSFFCSGEHQDRNKPFAILKSWIGQLIAKEDAAVKVAMEEDDLQQKISEGVAVSEADQEYLWSLLHKIITHVPVCTPVIDGYDECIDAKISKYSTQLPCRTYFLRELMKAISGTGTRVLLVSRNQRDIEIIMREPRGDPEALEVLEHAVTRNDTTRDVSSFSEAVFARKLTMDAEKMSNIADEAVKKSEGMFLWIALLDKNLEEGATKREVETLLSETPNVINGAYQKEMDRILNPSGNKRRTERAVVILKWVIFAARPLTVREMAEALAVSFNLSLSEYPHDDLPDPFTEESMGAKYVDNYIRMPCGSLIELRKEHEDTPLASDTICVGEPTAISQPQSVDYCSRALRPFPTNGATIAPYSTIHFFHFSVKEFLLQNPFCLIRSDRRLCFGKESTEHDWMASLCLQYMCYDEFEHASKNGVESPASFS